MHDPTGSEVRLQVCQIGIFAIRNVALQTCPHGCDSACHQLSRFASVPQQTLQSPQRACSTFADIESLDILTNSKANQKDGHF